MQPSSRSSNRTDNSFRPYQVYQPEEHDIFNTSFYEQKLDSAQSYQTVEFAKRYMNETNLSFIIQKIMQTILTLDKLPYNPYNLMYRLIHHQAIYQNLRRHYNQETEHHNFINSNIQQHDDSDTNLNETLFVQIRLKDKEIYLTQRLSKYVNMTNLYVFCKIVNPKESDSRIKSVREKFNFDQIQVSLGGPLILNLRGNNGILDVPVKLPRQNAQKSIYCAQSMLTTTMYLKTNRDFSKSINDFVDFIIDDILKSMEHKDENHTIYFQKLEVLDINEIFNLIEFSREQIINSGTLVQKELLRSLEKDKVTIRSKNIYRLSKELIPVVGQQLITVYKEYVLLIDEKGAVQIFSNEPMKYVFKQVFLSQKIIDGITQRPEYSGKDLLVEYKKEMIYHLLYHLKMQNISYLVWQIFYYLLYQNRSTAQHITFVNDLNHTISYILLSPMTFVHQLQHALRSVKWLTLPSFPTLSENQAYTIIIALEKDITAFIQKGNYIYWQLQIFYDAIKRLLSIIVEFKQLKLSALHFIIDHALLMLTGVTTNFNQILLVLQGNILSYINLTCQLLGQSKKETEKILSYDLFLKQKQQPSSVLRLNEEVKKNKKQLSIQQSQVKSIILGKYVAKYQFYEKIYAFYWQLIIGKKIMFPLSRFLKLLMINSTQFNYELFRQNYVKPKFKIQSHVINTVTIYEINLTETSTAFYSLHPDSLQLQALKQYKTILELIEPFMQSTSNSQANLGFRYGSKQSIESTSQNSSTRNRRILSIKSIDMGDNSAEQSSSFSVCKVLVDTVVSHNINSKSQLSSYVLDELNILMDSLDRQNFSVLGLFSYQQNHYEASAYDQHLYSKLLNEGNILRYDYKRKIPLDKFTKFLEYNLNQGRFIEVQVIYMVREVTKLLKISVNFYYKSSQNYLSLFKLHYVNQRVFPSKKDTLNWCEINQYKQIKENTGKSQGTNNNLLPSLKKLHQEKEISITEVLADRQFGQRQNSQSQKTGNKFKYYRQSPFYNLLRKISEILEVLLAVVQYLKVDRRGRIELSHLQSLYQLLKYYLIERCIIKDDYIYSEGVSVSMTNLMSLLKEYFQIHPDNYGQEKQLLQFQKILRKLWGLVKFAEISCTICIHQSLNLTLTPELS